MSQCLQTERFYTKEDPLKLALLKGPHKRRQQEYHPFQNHYTHDIAIFELFRGLQSQLSGVFRINWQNSHSFLVL